MATNPFAELPPTPTEHFRLYFFAAVLHVLEQVSISLGSREAAVEQFPFLAGYHDECSGFGLEQIPTNEVSLWWRDALLVWEESAPGHLPLRALRASCGLDHDALTLLLATGLIEEDARFGLLFESVQSAPGQHRPTLALLNAWWRGPLDCARVRGHVRRLQDVGLLQVVNPDAPRLAWALQPPAPVWDALRGDVHDAPAPWARYRPPATLAALDDLIVPDTLRPSLTRLPRLLESGEVRAVIVRGPHSNGRRTVLGAIARAVGRGLLEVNAAAPDDERWRLAGSLSTLLHTLPVVVFDLAPGETAAVPQLRGYDGPLGLVLGRQGGVTGAGVDRAVTLTLDMPDPAARRRHWQQGFGAQEVSSPGDVGLRYRMTGGNIRRAAGLARAYAALAGRDAVTDEDVQQASRALNRQALDTLAVRLIPSGDWSDLAVGADTLRELNDLTTRCRHRELLPDAVGPALGKQISPGVRALFTGPSGTGKTLAARLLAARLGMDLYRLDLSTVVNKYIGETEKNLNRAFTLAEELDVILLLDEGDALLTQRTNVQTSNDRYANLETNYLLQRLEAFEGILIVTTNAAERIDSAFQRRMDVLVEFRPPEAGERWAIWQSHLPATHAVEPALLREAAARCALTGGQIRNAVLHAALLAATDGKIVTASHLTSAVQREYRKMGTSCPLRAISPLAQENRGAGSQDPITNGTR